MQQIADHIVGSRSKLCERLVEIDKDIKTLKWKLWHGQVDRAISALEDILLDMNDLGQEADFSAARLHSLGQLLLTYIRSNRSAIPNYGARYRAGQRIATSLAESAVNSLIAKRMVKNQQMHWSQKGAHPMLQVRAAVTNGNLKERHQEKPDLSALPLHPIFQPIRPLLRAAYNPSLFTGLLKLMAASKVNASPNYETCAQYDIYWLYSGVWLLVWRPKEIVGHFRLV